MKVEGYICDKCKAFTEEAEQVIIDSAENLIIQNRFDLCPKCIDDLRSFLSQSDDTVYTNNGCKTLTEPNCKTKVFYKPSYNCNAALTTLLDSKDHIQPKNHNNWGDDNK